MKRYRLILWLVIILTLLSVFVDLPEEIPIKFSLGKVKIDQKIIRPKIDMSFGRFHFSRDLKIKQGIDLAGGVHLVFEADTTKITDADRQSSVESVRNNIERRVNLFGVSEPVVQTSRIGDSYRLLVEIPGISEIDQAIGLIGQTAHLQFWELSQKKAEGDKDIFQPTDLGGGDLLRSQVQFDPNTGAPVVGIKFNADGAKKFAEITARNINKPLAIYLDNVPVTAPMVKEAISSGEAVISGDFPLADAKKLSIQLNAGALPVPIKLIGQKNIGASLGADSIQKSIRAGLIGLAMVVIFMIGYYGWLGFLASVGLIIYGLLSLALYKLIPVTLTLPGMAGFILSVGMAVDSNILIFERMKEEIRAGRSRPVAMELGFGRAWDSIRDANTCTLITCFILLNPFDWSFLNNSGMVRGFALTLFMGVVLSLFTGVVVTRTILRNFSGRGGSRR